MNSRHGPRQGKGKAIVAVFAALAMLASLLMFTKVAKARGDEAF